MLEREYLSQLEADFDAYMVEQITARGDEDQMHVADLYGCDRATHARIHHADQEPVDPQAAFKMVMGKDFERHAFASFRRPLQFGLKIAMWLDWDGISGRIVPEDYEPGPTEIIGHPDAVAAGAVIEIKSVKFKQLFHPPWNVIVPQGEEDLEMWHRMQCAAYCLALGKPHAVLFDGCRASGERKMIAFDPEHLRNRITFRMQEMIDNLVRHETPEPTLHDFTLDRRGNSWLCRYCRYAGCEMNRNPNVKVREHAGS